MDTNRFLLRVNGILLIVLTAFGPINLPANAAAVPPTADQVFAAFKAASGGAIWDSGVTFTTISAISQGGLTGTDENWQDVITGCYLDKYTVGGVSGADGFDGKRNWSEDNSGFAKYLDSPEDVRDGVTNGYLLTMSYWYPQRFPSAVTGVRAVVDNGTSYVVVSVSPTGGYPVDLWFDDQTHLLARMVETTSRRTVTTYLSNFRKVDGVLLPFTTIVSTGGDHKYDLTMNVTEQLVNQSIATSLYDKPVAAAEDFTNTGSWPVVVPFTYSLGLVFVPVTIDGRGPFQAILDTGGHFAMTPDFANANKIKYTGRLPGTGTGSSTVRAAVGAVSALTIGTVTLKDTLPIVLPMPTPDPLIGAEIFNHFVVRIDFDRQELTLWPLGTFAYSGTGIPVPFRFFGDIPEVDGAVGNSAGGFMIDTGSGNTLDLFQTFVAAQELERSFPPAFTANGGFGIGGSQTVGVARINRFAVGGATMSDIVAYYHGAEAGSFSDTSVSGNIGMGFLHRYNLTFDYGRQIIYLEPNSYSSTPDVYERLGITIDATDAGAQVVDLVPNSPAALAGIEQGDTVTAVGGRPIKESDAAWLEQQMLLPAGTQLTLSIRHGRKTKSLTVTLRDLL